MRLFLPLALLLLAGCAPSAPTAPTEPPIDNYDPGGDDDDDDDDATASEIELDEDTILIEDHECFGSAMPNEERTELVLTLTCSADDIGIEEGSILVGAEAGGYLARVVSFEEADGTLTAVTTPATLPEVIQNGSWDVTIPLAASRGASLPLGGTVLYAGEYRGANVLVNVPSGQVAFEPRLHMSGTIDNNEATDFEASLIFPATLEMVLRASSTNGVRLSRTVPVFDIDYPVAFAIGPVPVAGRVGAEGKLGMMINGPGQASVELGFSAHGSIDVGVTQDSSGWDQHFRPEWDFTPLSSEFDIANTLDVKGFFRFDTTVELYGVSGPSFRVEPYIQGRAEAKCDRLEWEVKAGLAGKVIATVKFLDRFGTSRTFPLLDFVWPLEDNWVPWPFETPWACDVEEIRCGDVIDYGTQYPGVRSESSLYSCTSADLSGAERVYHLRVPADSSWAVEASLDEAAQAAGLEALIIDDRGEPWYGGICVGGGSTTEAVSALPGQSFWVVVDGPQGSESDYTLTTNCLPTSAENCSNGLDDDLDGYIDCTDEDCNGAATCTSEATVLGSIECGETLSRDTSDAASGASSTMDSYECFPGNYLAPEVVFEWVAPSSGMVEFFLVDPDPTVANFDVMVLDGASGLVRGDSCVAGGLRSVSFEAVAGTTYFLVADGIFGTLGEVQVGLDCTP